MLITWLLLVMHYNSGNLLSHAYVGVVSKHLGLSSASTLPIHTATEEQIDKAKEIIKKLTFKFQSDAFENPGTLYMY